MEGLQSSRSSRDINELLTNGFFKTARGKSPSTGGSPSTSSATSPVCTPSSFLDPRQTYGEHPRRDRSRSRPPRPTVEDEISSSTLSLDPRQHQEPRSERSRSRGPRRPPSRPAVGDESESSSSFLDARKRGEPRRDRSRSRGPQQPFQEPRHEPSRKQAPRRHRGPPPPRPTVEDEAVSLARETSNSPRPDYDPPLKGKIDQNPIILEAEVSKEERDRLHEIPCTKDTGDDGVGGKSGSSETRFVMPAAERQFVFIPKEDTSDKNKVEIEKRKREARERKLKSKAEESREGSPRKQESRREPVQEKVRSKESARREEPSRRDEPLPRDEPPRGGERRGTPRQELPRREPGRQSEPLRRDDRKPQGPQEPLPRREAGRQQEPLRRDERKEPTGPRQLPVKQSRERLRPQEPRREERGGDPKPPLERRKSRQDLPAIETKVPRDIPPQFRRSTSAYANLPNDRDATPKPATPMRPSAGEYLLSPEVARNGNKDYFSQPVPRQQQQAHDALWGSSSATLPDHRNGGLQGKYKQQELDISWGSQSAVLPNKRNSGGSFGGSRPGTPNSEKRHSGTFGNFGNFEQGRLPNEKLTRSQQLSEESARKERHSSSDTSGRSSRSSGQRHRQHSSSEDDVGSSDSGQRRRRMHRHRESDRQRPSPSRSNRSSNELNEFNIGLPTSKLSSPLPSPRGSPNMRGEQFGKAETFPLSRGDNRGNMSRPVSPMSAEKEMPRNDRLNPLDAASVPRPKSRQHAKTTNAAPTQHPVPPSHNMSLPVPVPIPSRIDVLSPGDTRRSPAIPQYNDNEPVSAREAKVPWQPPSFQPPPTGPSDNLEAKVGSFRRFSEDIERGNVPALPTCPRTHYTRGRNDWLTLSQCPSFDICPQCYNSTIASTEFRGLFIPSPRRGPDIEVLCDFGSSPWYRIAWLLTIKERRHDLGLFYGLANISSRIPPCVGKNDAVRQWHSVLDPKTGHPIRNFDACLSCVKCVEVLLPNIRGTFVVRDGYYSSTPRVCDLRFDSKRFVQYFDALETMADQAYYEGDGYPPDTRQLAFVIKRLAAFPECERDADLIDARWHIITQLPEFTVCEECFDEVVWPEMDEGKAIAQLFSREPRRIDKASCQLYSPKMRGIFRLACDGNDYKMLATKARERRAVEIAWKANLRELNGMGRSGRVGQSGVNREVKRIEEEWRRWE